MSTARLFGLTLMATALAMPALAKPDIMLRGRFDAEQMPAYDKDTTEAPTVLPVVMITKASAPAIYISKPTALRSTLRSKPQAAIVAEGRGQDPDRVQMAVASYPAS